MSKGLEKLKTIRHIHDSECGEDESTNKDFDIIEQELKMAYLVKRLFKDADLKEYKRLCPSDKKLCSEEEWNKFREWIKEN